MKHAKYTLEIKVNDKDLDKYTEMFEEAMNEMLSRDDCPEVYECYTRMKIEDVEAE